MESVWCARNCPRTWERVVSRPSLTELPVSSFLHWSWGSFRYFHFICCLLPFYSRGTFILGTYGQDNGLPCAVSFANPSQPLLSQGNACHCQFGSWPLRGQLALSPLLLLIQPPAPYHFRGKPPFRGIWTFWNFHTTHGSLTPIVCRKQEADMALEAVGWCWSRSRWESSVRPRAGQRPLRAAPKWGRASSGNRKQVKCLIHSFSAFFVSGTILGLGYNEENQQICLWEVYSILGRTNHKPINIYKSVRWW